MGRKHDIKEIDLQIRDISFFNNDSYQGMIIQWDSNIGFGEYTIYQDKNSYYIYGDSECMDSNEDKAFITELLKLVNTYILNNLKIKG